MSSHRRYKPRNFRFGQRLYTLRKQSGLTQDLLALKMGVAKKTIRNWESGANYPTDWHLRKLVELYLNSQVFVSGHEEEEARALWDHMQEATPRQKFPFDEHWFATLLNTWRQRTSDQAFPPDNRQLPMPPSSSEKTKAGVERTLPSASSSRLLRGDWSEDLDISSWYGRTDEVAKLERWLLQEQCRLVAVLGMGGIGKTTLAVKLVRLLAPHFDCVLWRSLYNAPPLEDVLRDWLPLLSDQPHTTSPPDEEHALAYLIQCLQERRCLLVLDNLEILFQTGEAQQRYRLGYEGYGRLIQYVAETTHQSCLLLTSRELAPELEAFIGEQARVRVLRLAGLDLSASQQLLQAKGVFGEVEAWQELVERYAGNPLALKIVAETVYELFGGDIASFLAESSTALPGIRHVLEEQFERVSALEQEVLYWLAIAREGMSLGALKDALLYPVARRAVMEALHSLRSRCLVERLAQGEVFTLQPVVLEYVTERLVVQVGEEICESRPALLCRHSLLQGQAKDYVRTSQERLLLQPLLDHLVPHFGSAEHVEAQCERLLQQLRTLPAAHQGYGGGNVINLLGQLNGHVRGKDCSHLAIWQADFQRIEAQDANFSGADLSGSVFLEAIDSIVSVAFSPDGRCIAGGSVNGRIFVWQAADGKPLLTLPGHVQLAWSLAFHPEGALLVSGGYDGKVKVWDINKGQCVRTLCGHTKWIRSVAVHPAGKLVATSGNDGSIRLWDITADICIKVWYEQPPEIWAVAFSPDGRFLASGDMHGVVKVWDLAREHCIWSHTGHQGSIISSLAFSPKSEWLVSAGLDKALTVWEVSTGEQLDILSGHTDVIQSVAFHTRGLLASASHDQTVKLWQIGQRESGELCLGTLHGHQGWVWSVCFAPDGSLISGGHEGVVKLWQINQDGKGGRCMRTLYGYPRQVSWIDFSPDGRRFVSGEQNGTVRVWETASGRCLGVFNHAGVSGAAGAAFCPDGRLVAFGTADQTINLWDVESKQLLRTLKGHRGEIWSLTFSSDGYFLASGSFDTTLKWWEVSSGQCLTTFQGHKNWIWSVACSPDGRLLASGDVNGEVKLWEIGSGQCLRTLQGGPQAIVALTFTPDGTMLLSSNAQGLLKLWDVQNGRCLKTLLGIEDTFWLHSVILSADGNLLVAGGRDQTIKVWQTATGELVQTFSGSTGRLQSVALSLDQRLLVGGTDEGSILLWEMQTGKRLLSLRCDRPYERMNIRSVTGITEAQRASLQALGALDRDGE